MRCANLLCLIFCIKRKNLYEYNLYSEIIANVMILCYITKVINDRKLWKLPNECDVKERYYGDFLNEPIICNPNSKER